MSFATRMLAALLAAALAACHSPDWCTEYDDELGRGDVEFEAHNNGTTTLYHDRCARVFEIVMNDVVYYPAPRGDEVTCGEAIAGARARCLIRPSSDWLELGPNGFNGMTWSGRFYTETQVRSDCLDGDPPKACMRAETAPFGRMRLVATMYATEDCSNGDCVLTDPVVKTAEFVFAETEVVTIQMVP